MRARDDHVADGSIEHERDAAVAPVLARIRSGVYGTVIAMSVLAYLGDHEPGPGVTAATVAVTGIVVFLAEAYAGLMAHTLARTSRPTGREVRAEVGECAYAAAAGIVAAVVLLLTAVLGLDVAARIDVTLWVGVIALALLSILAGRAAHRRTVVRVAWTLASLAVGTTIVLLKAVVH